MIQLLGGRRSLNDAKHLESKASYVSMLKHNIFSSLVSGAWVPALGFAISPKEINLLEEEAFGLTIRWGIVGAAVAYMGLGYFTLGAAVRSDITLIMKREEAIL